MKKRIISLAMAVLMCLSLLPMGAMAVEQGEKVKIEALRQFGNLEPWGGTLKFHTNGYSEGVMPYESVYKYSDMYYFEISGYCDAEGNSVIPLHKKWDDTTAFSQGYAIIREYDSELNKSILNSTEYIIDHSGNKVFRLGNAGISRLPDDSNGVFGYYISGNSTTSHLSENPLTVTFLSINDWKYTSYTLPYNKMDYFIDGSANLYTFVEKQILGYWEGANAPIYKLVYELAATVNTKGEVTPITPEQKDTEENKASVKSYHGFTYTMQDNICRIMNSEGKEVYSYAFSNSYKRGEVNKDNTPGFINEHVFLVPINETNGEVSYSPVDANGQLYPQYKFCDYQGSVGDLFYARAYKDDTGLDTSNIIALSFYDPKKQPVTLFKVSLDNTAPAVKTSSEVLINGKKVYFDAYNIGGNNYFKLRDLACALSGSEKQFEVSWDSTNGAIALTSGKAYTTVGGELAIGGAESATATISSSKVNIDNAEAKLSAYLIGGNNYFKLRDIGKAFNFGVLWDGSTNTVSIETDKGYIA